MSQIRRDLRKATAYYECNNTLPKIPLYLIKGSLNVVLTIASGSPQGEPIVEYLMQQRMYGISECKQNEDNWQFRQEHSEFEKKLSNEENSFLRDGFLLENCDVTGNFYEGSQ